MNKLFLGDLSKNYFVRYSRLSPLLLNLRFYLIGKWQTIDKNGWTEIDSEKHMDIQVRPEVDRRGDWPVF